MRISLEWAMTEEDRQETVCALCAAKFQPETVIVRVDPHGYEACEDCFRCLSKRHELGDLPANWPTWGDYRRELAAHPTVMFPGETDLELAYGEEAYNDFWVRSLLVG